jgi:hypothetical protein
LNFPELRLQGLQICFASADEKMRIADYRGDVSLLRRPERWLLLLNSISHFEERVRFWLLKCRFHNTVEELESLLRHLQDANTVLQNSESFKRLLRLVLDCGNVLNAGTASGCSFGFRLSALQQLQRLRSVDNKRSLLEVLAAAVLDDYPLIRSFFSEFECMQLASRGIRSVSIGWNRPSDALAVESDSLRTRVVTLQNELRRLEKFMTTSGSSKEGDGFQACFKDFLPFALERANQLQQTSQNACGH